MVLYSFVAAHLPVFARLSGHADNSRVCSCFSFPSHMNVVGQCELSTADNPRLPARFWSDGKLYVLDRNV